MILLLSACASRPTPPPPPVPHTVGERLGDRPYLYPIDAPPTVALVGGGSVPTTAATCGACHPDHYAEWSESTHAQATRDLQYTAELSKPDQPRWVCIGCHAPTRPQRWDAVSPTTPLVDPPDIERIVAEPEPLFDPARVAEGVTCATCHVRRDDDGQGVVVGPRGSGRAPHRVRHEPDALRTVCTRCHEPTGGPLTPTFVCWFETASEVAASPTPNITCPECHMPAAVRAPAVGAAELPVRRHLWFGGGVPKTYDGYAHLARNGWTPGFDVTAAADPVRIVLTNTRAAHLVPTGDPERHLLVTARLEAADGTELARDTMRIGQRWDWGDLATERYAHRIDDNRLQPGVPREWFPQLPPGGARVVFEVAHVRLTEANAAGMAEARLDEELLRLHPEAGAELPHFANLYPMRTVLYRAVVPLDGSAATVEVVPLPSG